MKDLIFGCGYLGARVAQLWQGARDTVHIVTRSPERAVLFEFCGWRPIVADVMVPESLAGLPTIDTVLIAIARDRDSDQPIRELYVDGLQNILDALPDDSGGIIYISSTGVYGQADGGWVDENSICEPQRLGGRACLEAERLLLAHPRGSRATILRMAGLYGPRRIPRRDDLLSQRSIEDPGEGYLNLVHVDDAAAVVVAAAARQQGQRIYNVSDGSPVSRREYLAELARCLGAPPPAFATLEATEARSERGATSKRVSNRRLLSELGLALRFPSYREGLRAIGAADE